MHVLILGIDSGVGRQLEEWLAARGAQVSGYTMAECNWRSERQVKKALRRHSVVQIADLRMAALLDADVAPDDKYIERGGWVARTVQNSAMNLLFVSSSRVFSGQLDRLYSEEDYPDGFTDLSHGLQVAETVVRERCERHIVLRLGTAYATDGASLMLQTMRGVRVEQTQTLCARVKEFPITAQDAARVISGVLDQISVGAEPWGIYHYCGKDDASRYETFSAVANQLEQAHLLTADASRHLIADKSGVALNRGLDCSKIMNTFGVQQMPWRKAVEDWTLDMQKNLAGTIGTVAGG